MKIVIVVDAQNDFIDGTLGSEQAQKVLPNIINYFDHAEKDDDAYVISTFDTHDENYFNTLEGKKLPVVHCQKYTKGWNQPDDLCSAIGRSLIGLKDGHHIEITKNTFSGARKIKLELEERNIERDEVSSFEIMGYCTDICVVSTALGLRALFPNTEINIVKDCCAGTTEENHEAALKVLQSCQCNII